MARTNLREVLEAIGASPQGISEDKDGVALLDLHLKRVQNCQHTDDLLDLVIVRDGARKALETTTSVRDTSMAARSHAGPLEEALKPLERLIARMEKDERDAAPKDEKGMVGLLSKELGLVQGLQHTDELEDLVKASTRAKRLLALSADVQKTSPATRSHAETLQNALAPVDRLIAKLQKELLPKPEAPVKQAAPQGKDPVPKRDESAPKDVAPQPPEVLPPALKNVQDAMSKGELAGKLAEPQFRSEVMNYLETVKGAPTAGVKKELLNALRAAPKTDTALRQKVFEKAFKCSLQSVSTGDQGEVASTVPPHVLDKAVDILESFPAEHLPEKWKLNKVPGKGTSGTYIPETQLAQFDFGEEDDQFDQDYLNAVPGDPLEGTKCFDVMVRHELGHAVHATKGGNALTDSMDGGQWRGHKTLAAVIAELDDLVTAQAADLKTKLDMADDPKPELLRWLGSVQATKLQGNDNGLKQDFATATFEFFSPKSEAMKKVAARGQKMTALKDALDLGQALFKVIRQGIQSNAFFSLGPDPVAHNGRVYLDSGLGDDGWVSFAAATRKKMVSMYQYRAPGEWFAEFYATVNNGDAGVRKKGKAAYPAAYTWMQDKGMLIYKD